MSNNPLLAADALPDFAAIRPDHVVPAVEAAIAAHAEAMKALAARPGDPAYMRN